MARGGQSYQFFLQKRHFLYKLSVKKQKTGRKTGKKNSKKPVFPAPPTVCMGLASNVAQRLRLDLKCCATFQAKPGMLRNVSGQTRNVVQRFRPNPKCCALFQAKPGMLRIVSGLAWDVAQRFRPNPYRQLEGLTKNRFLEGFCPFFALFFACCPFMRT